MHLLEWDDRLATGHAGIDAEHRAFVELANRLALADDADLSQRLREFEAHARAHFGQEDALMRSSAYPSAACHVDEHAAVLASVAEVIALVDAGRFGIGRDLTAHLLRWFPAHTEHMDAGFVYWLHTHTRGGTPIRLHRAPPAPRGVRP